MAISFTQTLITAINTRPNATTATGKFGAAATAGRFVAVVIKVSGGQFVTSVTDTRNNTWFNPAYNLSSGPDVEIWYTYVTTGIQLNDLLTVSVNGGTAQITNIIAASFSQVGFVGGTNLDITTGALTTSSGAAASKAFNLGTTAYAELIIAAVGTSGASSQTFTTTLGGVIASTDAVTQTALIYYIQPAPGNAALTISWTTSVSFVYAASTFFPIVPATGGNLLMMGVG